MKGLAVEPSAKWCVLTFLMAAAIMLHAAAPPVRAAQTLAQDAGEHRVEGTVLDPQGLPVVGAQVVLVEAGRIRKSALSSTQPFQLGGLQAGTYELRVEAAGFEPQTVAVDLRTESSVIVEVRLNPGRFNEDVVVTPTRTEQRLGDVPASVQVLTREAIEASPALIVDDVLRKIPTFSLFRRASGLAANPTAQGVSLRGIGPSGQSRTLVLLDGIPFNDPFGSWVYWTRVPLVSVDRIEITEGPTSSVYGNYAMGGVINIITSQPTRRTIEIKPQYGGRKSSKVDFFASDRWGKLGAAIEGSFFNTEGFPIVAKRERGPIDNNAEVDYRNITAKLEYTPTDRLNAFFRAGYFTEDRVNAKVGEVNDTKWTAVSGGFRMRLRDESDLQARLFVDRQKSHFNFLAVTNAATTRNIVRLATDQRVPANGVGGMVQWTRAIGASHVFSAGSDWRWVDGDSEEDAFVAAVPTVIIPPVTQTATLTMQRVTGGTQRSLGAFVQDIFTPVPDLIVTLAARVDQWKNYEGHFLETAVATGLPTANNRPTLPDKDDTVLSPRIAALYHVSDRASVWGAVNSGFRAPTLTELYRQFAVGAIVTRPNDQLGPERLVGGEIGINVQPTRNVTIRTTWFDNRLKDAISNVTIGVNFVQKQNLGRTRVRGIQTDVEYRLGSFWRFSGAHMFNDAKVTDGGTANAGLVGKYLQQVPRHRGSVQMSYSNPKYASVALSVQFSGLQFNDDLNVNFIPAATLAEAGYATSTTAGLPKYAVVDMVSSRNVGQNVQVFFGVQNLFDKIYFVQTNPSTIGTPRLVNAGMRIRFAGR